MKKKLLSPVICVIMAALLLSGCSASGTAQEPVSTEAEIVDEEILAKATVSINDTKIILPVSYKEFAEKTGYTFENSSSEKYTDKTRLPAYTTLALNYEFSNGYMLLLVANQTAAEIAASDGTIIGFKIFRYQKEDMDVALSYNDLDWNSSNADIIEKLGDPDNAEQKDAYYLSGYSKKRTDSTNVSYSFVADDERIYSFALSIDNILTSYGSLEALEEETTK